MVLKGYLIWTLMNVFIVHCDYTLHLIVHLLSWITTYHHTVFLAFILLQSIVSSSDRGIIYGGRGHHWHPCPPVVDKVSPSSYQDVSLCNISDEQKTHTLTPTHLNILHQTREGLPGFSVQFQCRNILQSETTTCPWLTLAWLFI